MNDKQEEMFIEQAEVFVAIRLREATTFPAGDVVAVPKSVAARCVIAGSADLLGETADDARVNELVRLVSVEAAAIRLALASAPVPERRSELTRKLNSVSQALGEILLEYGAAGQEL